MRSTKRTLTAAAACTTALLVAATSATSVASAPAARSDSGPSGQRVLVNDVGGPFQIALRGKKVYYVDVFDGTINRIGPTGPQVVRTVLFANGFEFSRDGKTMAIAHGDDAQPGSPQTRVTLVRGGRQIHAQVGQYEQNVNPDRNQTYGLVSAASTQCRTELASMSRLPVTYTGRKFSQPAQVEPLPRGAFAVADSAGNDILRVDRLGRISVIAVLPPQRVRLTQAQADAMFSPSCVGAVYAFEPVPTDVERGPGGVLWVTTLPSGSEAPGLGGLGSIYRIKRGVVTRMAGGFRGANNLDLVRGRFYVAEWYGDKVTKLGKGGRFTRYNIPDVISVEATRKHLYIGTFSPGPSQPGKVIRLRR